MLREFVGDVLRRHRLRQRRTLADVAGSARVSTQYLSELERGRKEASSEVLAAICAALRIDLSELLGEVRLDLARDGAPVAHLTRDGGSMTRLEPARDRAPVTRRPGDAMLLAA